ncbi:MAG: hypothetical protein Q9168_006926, partial [Polycauliona sp. 1 TL-2023]
MNPQHRLILESSYEALENDPETAPRYQTTGCAFSILANRVSYAFDLKGPSCALDTACSSSLTALHLACQSLRLGEAVQAIVTGVGVLLSPDMWCGMSSLGYLVMAVLLLLKLKANLPRLFSEQGRCFSFDSRASGYGRGEGIATVVLKPLQDAIRDNDRIHSIIRHTGVNHDGRTRGIVLPNRQAQTDLIQRVYREARLDPSETHYVEMHGPGTAIGDPIEAASISEAVAIHKSTQLVLGSVKSNVGHMEGASGLAGLIKTCLVLAKGIIPPVANFQSPNQRIPLRDWNLQINTSMQAWPPAYIRRASVSSFGFGGANSHIILEGPPEDQKAQDHGSSSKTTKLESNMGKKRVPKLIVLSAADPSAAIAQAANLVHYIRGHHQLQSEEGFASLVHTLASRRTHLEWRLAIAADSTQTLLQNMDVSKLEAKKTHIKPARLSFVFSGQGSQWQAMGQSLMRDFRVFSTVIADSDRCLCQLGAKWSLKDVIHGVSSMDINDPQISQPATTAVQIGVTSLLKSWGIIPTKVTGHSSGEFAAAYAVGALSLQSCLSIAYHRGRLASSLVSSDRGLHGSMLAVGASHAKVNAMLKQVQVGTATVACINSPSLVVASGDDVTIRILETFAQSEKLFSRIIPTGVAYHSHHMHAIADEYLDSLGEIEPSPGSQTAFYSSLQGGKAEETSLSSLYWVEHLFSPVKFCAAVEDMLYDFQTEAQDASMVVVEIGPHSSLKHSINHIVRTHGWAHKVTYLPSLLKEVDTTAQMLQLAISLFMLGQPIDLDAVNFPHGNQCLKPLGDLPPYAWNHDKSYWHESRVSRNYRLRPFPRNDLLGSLVPDFNDLEPRWRNILRASDLPWLLHHTVLGTAVFPFAGYIAMALEASRQWSVINSVGPDAGLRYEFREILISRPLIIPKDGDVETSVTLRALADGTRYSASSWNEFTINSWTQDQGWIENCKGLIRLAHQSSSLNRVDEEYTLNGSQAVRQNIKEMDEACQTPVNCKDFYHMVSRAGLEYGPTFQNLFEARSGPGMCVGHVKPPNTAEIMPRAYESRLMIHPALLDALFHAMLVSLAGELKELDDVRIPTFIKSFSISSRWFEEESGEYICYGTRDLNKGSGQQLSTSLKVFDRNRLDQAPDIELEGMMGAAIPREDSSHQVAKRGLCYKLEWQPWQDTLENPEATGSLQNEFVDANPETVTFTYINRPSAEFIQNIQKSYEDGDKILSFLALQDIAPEHVNYVFIDFPIPILQNLDAKQLAMLQALFGKAASILWVTCGARATAGSPWSSMSVGWTRCLRCETVKGKLVTLDFDPGTLMDHEKMASMLLQVFRDVVIKKNTSVAIDLEFAEVNGVLNVPRLCLDEGKDQYVSRQLYGQGQVLQPYKQENRNLQIKMSKPGQLQSITFVDSHLTAEPLGDDQVEIDVQATGVNFKDVMIGLGQIQHQELGFECSGLITQVGDEAREAGFDVGDRICAITNACYANLTRASHEGVIKIPGDMSFVTAASIPIVYCTAYYALFDVGRLSLGEAILIHSAAGGVGQAAVMLAQHAGAKVFATVGSEEKKVFLAETYGIPPERIFSSRAINFEQGILKATGNKGVALVLSSVSGEMRRLSMNVLAPMGRLVEIGKRDLELNAHLEMNSFTKALTFAAVDLEILGRECPSASKRILTAVFDALRDHPETIKPVTPITTFPASKIETALRTLQAGKHMGKLVIEAKVDGQVLADALPEPLALRSDATYLITGGTGGIGRSLARWMAAEGAKSIILASRSGHTTEEVPLLVQELENIGTRVVVETCDITSERDVEQLISCPVARGLPPIAGVIHGAMVLQDVLFEKSTIDDFNKVTAPRVKGAWNLHHAFLATKTHLDFFVLLSSTVGILGNPGQSAYAATNSFLDAFAHFRRKTNLPASSIDLGLVQDIGYVARNLPPGVDIGSLVHDPINEKDLHALVKAAVAGERNPECNYTQTITGIKLDGTKPLPFWAADPKMRDLHPALDNLNGADNDLTSSLRTALKRCHSYDVAVQIVCDALIIKLAAISWIPKEELDLNKNMDVYGIDSL